jgi:hypothetical protein
LEGNYLSGAGGADENNPQSSSLGYDKLRELSYSASGAAMDPIRSCKGAFPKNLELREPWTQERVGDFHIEGCENRAARISLQPRPRSGPVLLLRSLEKFVVLIEGRKAEKKTPAEISENSSKISRERDLQLGWCYAVFINLEDKALFPDGVLNLNIVPSQAKQKFFHSTLAVPEF